MKKLMKAALVVATLCLALPAIGLAGLPEPSNTTIKPPATIGGVKLGMKLKKADKAWGKTGDCQIDHGVGSCFYKTKSAEDGTADISSDQKGKVFAASIDAGLTEKGKWVFGGPTSVFETPEGIGLGDKGSKVKKAYPNAKKVADGGYVIAGKGKGSFTFVTGDGKHITSIYMAAGEQG
jgi:hypothetical protein